jgi:hypothetical protein
MIMAPDGWISNETAKPTSFDMIHNHYLNHGSVLRYLRQLLRF